MNLTIPEWVDPRAWMHADDLPSRAALTDVRDFRKLLLPVSQDGLEHMACRAQHLTRRHFGKTISLYVPLYLSNYCPGGCVYCGFASDRQNIRSRLDEESARRELLALKEMGFEEVLLLTGERAPEAGFDYLRDNVAIAAEYFHKVTIEAFAMETDEYRQLVEAGCTGVTLYQETYDPELYDELHRWGPKKDYMFRIEAPGRALASGMRTVGIGALLGLGDPILEFVALFRHARHLQRDFWRGGISVSFPRMRPQTGGYQPPFPVSDLMLAQAIYAFRLSLPDMPLVLSTRERAAFRDGMAGIGINKMSVASRTTVGGYSGGPAGHEGQFEVEDRRDVTTFCTALHQQGLEPVFKNWEKVLSYQRSVTGS